MNLFTFTTDLDAGMFGRLFFSVTVSFVMDTHGDDDTPYRKADEIRELVVRGAPNRNHLMVFLRPQGCPPSLIGQDILPLLDQTFDDMVLDRATEAMFDHDTPEEHV